MIDEYVFGPQNTDISEGRFPNGNNNWVFFENPSPGASNGYLDVPDFNSNSKISAYPNPTTESFVNLTESRSYRVYNSMGQFVEEKKKLNFINTSSYNNGLYFVVIDTGQTIKLMVQ